MSKDYPRTGTLASVRQKKAAVFTAALKVFDHRVGRRGAAFHEPLTYPGGRVQDSGSFMRRESSRKPKNAGGALIRYFDLALV
jgi:hypothetical protein